MAAYVMAPVVAFYLASLGWAMERSEGTLRWLYARPLPSIQIFLIRVLSIFAVTAVWTLVALLANGVSPPRLMELTSQLPWVAVGAWVAGVGLGVGGGCLASALFQRRDAVIMANVVGALTLLVLVPWVMLEHASTTTVLLAAGQRHLLSTKVVYGILLSLALLLGTGYAMYRTPVDRARYRRALITVPLLAVAGAVLWIMIQRPLSVSREGMSYVRWLGDGVTLGFAEAPGLDPWILHPVLVDEDGGEQSFNQAFAIPGLVLAHPGRGLAVVREFASARRRPIDHHRWLVIDRRGEVQHLELGENRHVEPIGWSPQGTRFAWKETYRYGKKRSRDSRMAVMNDEMHITWVGLETPSAEYTAAWIDEERLFVVPPMLEYKGDGWWMVVKANGATELGPETLPQGHSLFSPAFAYPLEYHILFDENYPSFSPAPLARRGNEPVVSLIRCDDDVSQLVTLDTRAGELQPLPGTQRAIPFACGMFRILILNGLVSVGPLPDGGLVWAESVTVSETRIVTMDADALEPRQVCTIRGDDAEVGGFRGTAGAWALWADLFERRLVACQVETGEVRTLALETLGGARAVDIVDGGVLTPTGFIELN
jgi:hypothetical protein